MNHTGTEITSAILNLHNEPLSAVAKCSDRELAGMRGRIIGETSLTVAAFQASI
ncbi:hypothetical protein [Herbidospora cretacea]|uniref:hypothetical protein n=1 Tax=Herbidospora cretacea TaxID=28444 RepID=UPI000A4BDCD5|nr:hypothetical protein [Herbidospora cretacea]